MNKGIIWIILVVVILGAAYYLTTNDREADNTSPNLDLDNTNQADDDTTTEMSFFITSQNPGTGANLGGLAGADSHCQMLASQAGAGDKNWRAYLSATATGTEAAVNARDRIGNGPWHNINGALVANNLEELHSSANRINKETGLSENGDMINGRGDSPNVHDILTGSNPDGTLAVSEGDTTCSNWTSESADGSAIVGHHDRMGLDESDAAKSWNSSHGSRGCSLPNLNSTGGGGLLYCFAVN